MACLTFHPRIGPSIPNVIYLFDSNCLGWSEVSAFGGASIQPQALCFFFFFHNKVPFSGSAMLFFVKLAKRWCYITHIVVLSPPTAPVVPTCVMLHCSLVSLHLTCLNVKPQTSTNTAEDYISFGWTLYGWGLHMQAAGGKKNIKVYRCFQGTSYKCI